MLDKGRLKHWADFIMYKVPRQGIWRFKPSNREISYRIYNNYHSGQRMHDTSKFILSSFICDKPLMFADITCPATPERYAYSHTPATPEILFANTVVSAI